MSNKCPTCSQSGVERSNPQGEARCGEPVSRNANELDSASLRKVGVANLPDWTKPAIIGEATLVRSRWAPRGGWRQRAGKEKSRNLRDPSRPARLAVRRDVNPSRPGRESEGIVVAGKQGNSCGAKGSHCESETIDRSIPACQRRLREKRCVRIDGIGAGNGECLQESRMREIRKSGLTRGSNGIGLKPPVALYSTGSYSSLHS